MSIALDDLNYVKAVDRSRMRDILSAFGRQLEEAGEIGRRALIDSNLFNGITNLVFAGLGGSAIGADLIRAYLAYESPFPIFVNRHYRLPAFVNERTLLVASSYSGDTEETLSAFEEALARRCRVIVVSSGGELTRQAKDKGLALIEIPKRLPPRSALGYLMIPVFVALSNAGIGKVDHASELKEAVRTVRTLTQEYNPLAVAKQNTAKAIALDCQDKFPLIYGGADDMDPVAMRWRTQMEENAKTLASHHLIPEMNHNELVGWKLPADFLKETCVILLRDEGDHPRVGKRLDFVKKIVSPLTSKLIEVKSQGSRRLARMFSLIHLGDWVSFYSAILNGVDPTPVEVIDTLKKELAKMPNIS